MTATRRPLVDDLNGDPHQNAVLAGVRQMLADGIFVPWVTARWDNTVIVGRVHKDEVGHPYLFANVVWYLHRGTVACRYPDKLLAAVPAWDNTPDPMPATDLATTINVLRNTDQVMLCDATFVNRETCMTITDAQIRVTPTRTEIRAGHRWLTVWTRRHGIEPKLTRAHVHQITHLGATR